MMKTRIIKVPIMGSNAYLLKGKGGLILVDTGQKGGTARIKKTLTDLGQAITDIDLIIITHVHYDHVGSLAQIKKESSAEVIVHEAEADLLRSGSCGFPKGTMAFSRALSGLANRFMDGSFEPVEPEIVIDTSFDLEEFGLEGEIVHTPGHTEGSLSVILDDGNCIVGDTLFNVLPRSVYPPFANKESRLMESWKKIREYDCKKYYPGHGRKFGRDKFEKSFKKLIYPSFR